MTLEKPPETDSYGVPLAPAPPPPPRLAGPADAGFAPKSSRLVLEVLAILLLVIGLGCGAIFGGGAVAEKLTPLVPNGFDRSLGELSQKQLAIGSDECTNPEAKRYVEEIAAPLLAELGEAPFSFQFRVVKDDQINAFALPGGFVTVNSGLLDAAESGEEVAGVLGHELQHALLRHGTRRMLREIGGSLFLSMLIGGTSVEGLGSSAKSLTNLAYDRDQESEADLEGARLMIKAGLDPSGLSTFFARLKKENSLEVPTVLSTHPDPGDRAGSIARLGKPTTVKKLRVPGGVRCE